MVMLAGRWAFFDEEKFQGTKVRLGVESYLHGKDHGIKDNNISSLRLSPVHLQPSDAALMTSLPNLSHWTKTWRDGVELSELGMLRRRH